MSWRRFGAACAAGGDRCGGRRARAGRLSQQAGADRGQLRARQRHRRDLARGRRAAEPDLEPAGGRAQSSRRRRLDRGARGGAIAERRLHALVRGGLDLHRAGGRARRSGQPADPGAARFPADRLRQPAADVPRGVAEVRHQLDRRPDRGRQEEPGRHLLCDDRASGASRISRWSSCRCAPASSSR